MAKAKWIFGNQNPVVPVVASKPIPIPVLKEADLKKIGLENVRLASCMLVSTFH